MSCLHQNDAATGAAIIDLLFGRLTETGATLVLITHDADLAPLCDRIITMRDGLIPFAALALIGLLLVQTNALPEGRYRKPAEPLLIAGAFILVHRLRIGKAAGSRPTRSDT